MTTPASKPCERARNATPGVVITPALRAATPTDASPCRNLSAIQWLETRVSCPITTRAFAFTRIKIVAQRPSNPIHAVARQRKLSRDAANSIRPKKLSGLCHEFGW